MEKQISIEQLANLFFDSLIEKIPLKSKMDAASPRPSEKKSSNTMSSSTSSEKHSALKNRKNGSTDRILTEKKNLIKQVEVMQNRIEMYKQQEREYYSRIERKKKKELSIEKIKTEKEKQKEMLEKMKKEEEERLKIKKELIRMERDNEVNGLKESIETKIKNNKIKYQVILEERKRANSQRLIVSLTNEHNNRLKCNRVKNNNTIINRFINKKSNKDNSVIDEEKETQLLEKKLSELAKQEELFKQRVENAKKNYNNSNSSISRNIKGRNKSALCRSVDDGNKIHSEKKTFTKTMRNKITNSIDKKSINDRQKELNKEIAELNKRTKKIIKK